MKSSNCVPLSAVFLIQHRRKRLFYVLQLIHSFIYLFGLAGINHRQAHSSVVTYSLCDSSKHPVVIVLSNASEWWVMKGNKINKISVREEVSGCRGITHSPSSPDAAHTQSCSRSLFDVAWTVCLDARARACLCIRPESSLPWAV